MIGGSADSGDLLAKLQRQLDHLSDLTPLLQAAGDIVRDGAVMRIKDQGGDQSWVPNKRGGHTGIDTGRMMSAIQVSAPNANSVTIGDDVEYARWFQEGTGIYAGHQPWIITGKPGGGLKFTIGGVTYVRREVVMPGEPARPFLLIGDTERAGIADAAQVWASGGDL